MGYRLSAISYQDRMPADHHDEPHPTDRLGLPEGLLAAVVCAGLLIGSFAVTTAYTIMPSGERWAALTTFGLLAVAYTLPGSAALYDALGRTVRRDRRAFGALAALLPALYLAYSATVGQFQLVDLIAAALFAAVPAASMLHAAGSRSPTSIDAVGLGYLWLSLQLDLLPSIGLPEQGALVGFFQMAAPPLLLLLLAARGWPGLGFTWFLSAAELRIALVAGGALAAAIGGLAWSLGLIGAGGTIPGGGALIGAALAAYFFTALPAEMLLRGVAQSGVARALAARGVARANMIGLVAAAALAGLGELIRPGGRWQAALVAAIGALGYGWVYLRTGKVTASAVPHMFVALLLAAFAAA
jgi:membrane protease YdiL (CAAX protease family)